MSLALVNSGEMMMNEKIIPASELPRNVAGPTYDEDERSTLDKLARALIERDAAIRREEALKVEVKRLKAGTKDLAALVKLLAKRNPVGTQEKKALDYLMRRGLMGSILRDPLPLSEAQLERLANGETIADTVSPKDDDL